MLELVLLVFLIWFFLMGILVRKLIVQKMAEGVHRINYIMDEFVDTIVEKAVIIAFNSEQDKDIDEESRELKRIDLALNIIADVMLQHGLTPKNYNLAALVTVARFKLNLLTGGGDK